LREEEEEEERRCREVAMRGGESATHRQKEKQHM